MRKFTIAAALAVSATLLAAPTATANFEPCGVPLDYPGPCVWDADARYGVSHRVDVDGFVHYVSDRKAARLLYDGKRQPCEFEDSRDCVWDAKHMGNGKGDSFKVGPRGHVTDLTHRRAHRLLYGV